MSRLGDKIRVPPLEPARLARIEENLLAARQLDLAARPHRSAAWWPRWTAATAVAAVALAIGLAAGWFVADGSGKSNAAPLVSSVVTAAGQRARVTVQGAVVELGESSEVTVHPAAGGGVRIDLARGKVDCDVEPHGGSPELFAIRSHDARTVGDPRPGRPPFSVKAGDVDVSVVGTAFSVERGSDVRVSVTRGKVRVTRARGEPVSVAAGERWSSDGRVAAGPSPDQNLAGRPTGRGSDETIPPLSPHLPVPDPSSRPDPQPTSAESTASNSNRRTNRDRGRATAPSLPVPAGLAALADCPTVEACLDRALRGRGATAAQALYTLVHRELFEHGRAADALAHIDLYERRFAARRPAEAEAILWLRVLALSRTGDRPGAAAAARTYLARHPRGRHRSEAERLASE